MGTPLQVERPFSSLSSYSLSDTHISTSQQPTFHYDSINEQRLYEHIPSHIPFPPPYTNPPRVRNSTDTSTSKQSGGMSMMNTGLGADDNMSGGSGTMKRTNKTHVPSACVNCKRAHLACDVSRPCKRCVALGKVDTCIDIKHKKRGRPKLKDKKPHPYNTHATADAKTWVQNPQFLPPTTTNPNPPNLHHQSDQSSPLSSSHSFSTFISSTSHHSSSRHNLHHHHNRHHHYSTPYITKSPKFINQHPTSISRQQTHSQQENTPIITMFVSINGVTCARVSDECLGIMGYYPSELVHKSLYDYVHAQDTEKLQKLISSLLDNANRYHQNQTAHQSQQYQFLSSISDPVTTEDPGFSQINPEDLQYPALGGPIIEVFDEIHLKQRIGQYDLYNVKMYLGGGFCADLTRKETWNKLYIVARFTRIKLGTCFSNDGSNYVQPRMNGNSVGGFSTQIISPPTTTIDPALLTMHNTSINNNIGSSSSSLVVGRSVGLLSPVSSPRHSEVGPAPLYNEINHSSPTFNFSHRKPLHPYNSHDHFSQDHRSFSESFAPISRPNPVTPIVSQPEPLVSPSSIQTCSSSGSQSSFSFERRSSAFNAIRSPSDGTISLSIPFYEVENKSLDSSLYTNQSNRFNNNNNDNITFNHPHDGIPSPSSNNSFPTFQNDERVVEGMMIPTISRKSSSHVGRVGEDSASTTRMSVNSLLC